ncbi:hypothetical protein [Nocardioides albus]|uniref:Uncharacterized protein n=1 Tax=Nocardioides albus TaxID=1841 RepID=A0A7W5A3C0_9ACTN|nr:hypothetical protein [Nocardioides albus]MBB3088499.1 hypothetical protein [Nocardioides albus]GGU16717.1 hypothetical protein GCM10007979_13880 [Nocardioides albus]
MSLVVLVLLGLLDAAFSGFRSAQGRSGLVDHAHEDHVGMLRGVRLFPWLSSAAVGVLAIDLLLGQDLEAYVSAADLFLLIIAPFAAVVLLALAAYGILRWELRYLASAIILGPCTFLRPYVVTAAAIVVIVRAGEVSVAVAATLAVIGVLAVEPVLDRRAK